MKSLAAAGATSAGPALLKIVGDPVVDPAIHEEATAAFGALAGREHTGVLLDLLTHRSPFVRATAMRALARIDADMFLSALASLDADPDWTVRVAQAQALGALPAQRGEPRLRSMLSDEDPRVVPAVAPRWPPAMRQASSVSPWLTSSVRVTSCCGPRQQRPLPI